MADNAAALDWDGMSVKELRTLARDANARADAKVEAETQAILDETRTKLAELDVNLDALLKAPKLARKERRDGGKVPVKYRGPKGETWTGRGKPPLWLAEAEKQGRKREHFLIAPDRL